MNIAIIQETAFSFPLVLFTLLLPVVLIYWLLVAVRVAPLQLFERDSLRDDHLASTMVSLGFAGVPVTMALSVLFVYAAVITLVAELLVLRWFDLALVIVPLAIAVLWGAFALASPLAAKSCRALLRHYRDRPSFNQRCLLGERVQVVGFVDQQGCCRAVLCSDGTREVCLRGKPGSMPKEGEVRVLVKYLDEQDGFRSVAEREFLDARTRLVRLKLIERHEPVPPQDNAESRQHRHYHGHHQH
ncbi:hypothetical protein [Halomonas sp. DP8Y7-1]|uniref:hypothetical protein n=1 Tax=Halomonas sp. DP8Y7-1 TaxID=2859078 RepID=UPI0021BD566A|nr:hypothetical protein [Halomonas sp. DP8Y7-1]